MRAVAYNVYDWFSNILNISLCNYTARARNALDCADGIIARARLEGIVFDNIFLDIIIIVELIGKRKYGSIEVSGEWACRKCWGSQERCGAEP